MPAMATCPMGSNGTEGFVIMTLHSLDNTWRYKKPSWLVEKIRCRYCSDVYPVVDILSHTVLCPQTGLSPWLRLTPRFYIASLSPLLLAQMTGFPTTSITCGGRRTYNIFPKSPTDGTRAVHTIRDVTVDYTPNDLRAIVDHP